MCRPEITPVLQQSSCRFLQILDKPVRFLPHSFHYAHTFEQRRRYFNNIHCIFVDRKLNAPRMVGSWPKYKPKYSQIHVHICIRSLFLRHLASIWKTFTVDRFIEQTRVLFCSLCLRQDRLFPMSVAKQIEAEDGIRSKSWMFDARLQIAAPQNTAGVADRMPDNYFEDVLAICSPYQFYTSPKISHQ